ncbi:N-ethylmaleimide reductase [Bradyrhizobium yuanmingense]
MKFEALFKPLQVGPYQLAHRVAMAPLTRMRAERDTFAPRPLNAEYYGQRATKGGLIIAEASPVLSHGRGNPATPGIYSEAQVAGWRKVTDAVHAKGGVIFLQLWHVGRVSHSSFHGGELPVSASAIPIKAEGMKAMTADGKIADYETPRALETDEVKGIVEAFRQGAKNALAAGFDGVEIHGANGYLLEQFLQSRSNQRTDQYGGGIEDRARLLLEVTQAAIDVWGSNRVAVRLSPYGIANDSGEPDPMPLYTHVVKALEKLGLGVPAFHRTALQRLGPRRGQLAERAIGDGAVPSALQRRADDRRRLHRGDRECGDRRRTCGHHRLRPHLHLQS